MMPPPPQMVPLWRLWLHAASERARAASQRTARARWGGDRATRSTDGSGDGTGVGSGVGSVVGSGVGSAVGSAVGSGDGSGVGSVDGSGIGRVVGSAAESDGGSGVVSRVSSARRSADNQSRLPAFMLSDHRGFVTRPPGVCFSRLKTNLPWFVIGPSRGLLWDGGGLLKTFSQISPSDKDGLCDRSATRTLCNAR